jgi:hypothetical protein
MTLLTTVDQDRGYGAFSALALAVEAVEALHLSSPTVTPSLTAAVRSFGRSVLYEEQKEHHMHATIRRYEGVDMTRTSEVVAKVNETLVPQLRELPGFAGYYLIEAGDGVLSSLGLFETPAQADESTELVAKWISDEEFDTVIPNAPEITSGKVVAQSNGLVAVA